MCLRKCNKPCDKFTLAICLDRIRSEKELKILKEIDKQKHKCPTCNSTDKFEKVKYKGETVELCFNCNPILREIRGIS